MMGAERRSMVMSEEERRNTAYHEAGHAIVGLSVPYDPLHKVTIIPRGRALGVTMNLPEGDRHSAAPANGARRGLPCCSADVKPNSSSAARRTSPMVPPATSRWRLLLARSMVMEWGMSDKLGRVRYNGNEQEDVPRPFRDPDQEHLR